MFGNASAKGEKMSVEKIGKELEMRHWLEMRVALIHRFGGGQRMGGREGVSSQGEEGWSREERAGGGSDEGGRSRDRERGNSDNGGWWSQKRTPKRRLHRRTHG